MSLTPFVTELQAFKHAPEWRFKGRSFKAGAMKNLYTNICYSPGQDLSNNVFGSTLQQSFNFLISQTQAISGVVSESTFKA